MENFRIRKATETDIPIILGLLFELGRPKPKEDNDVEKFRKKVKNYLSNTDKQILVGEIDDVEIIGMISVIFLHRLNRINFEMYIPELIVKEKFQGKGLGTELINACMKIARNKKCHRIRLESGNQRRDAHKFYKRLQFKQTAISFTRKLDEEE